MENEFSLKELYDTVLKSTYKMEINNRVIEAGEVVARFDKIHLANFQEMKTTTTARGGFDNRARIIWETTKEVQLVFTQGIFSKEQFSLMMNSKMLLLENVNNFYPSQRDTRQTDENGHFELKYPPVGTFYVYKMETGEKITSFDKIEENIYSITDLPYTDIIVDYNFSYNRNINVVKVGQGIINGFLYLEGRTRTKDDITGQVRTGILRIPKLKLMSELSMRLGEQANPLVGTFKAVGHPVGTKGNQEVMEIIFLEDDIDSDI